MAPSRTLRRSSRLASQRKQVTPQPQPTQASPPRSRTKQNKEKYLESWLRDGSIKLSNLISDEVSDSENDSESEWHEDESNCDSGELIDLTRENIEYHAGQDISRNTSYDSRFEPGNEEYEYDDFVVADDASTDTAGDDTSTVGPGNNTEETPSPRTPRRRLAYRPPKQADRKISDTTATSSNLFVSELPWQRRRSSMPKSEAVLSGVLNVIALDSAGEVMDEIMDAVALFSRRCNRNKAPLCISLSAKVLDDVDVRTALEDAKGIGCAQLFGEDTSAGTETWTIGPPRRGRRD